MDEKRAHYRVDLPEGYLLAAVSKDGASGPPAEVFDMSFNGAGLKVRGPVASTLAVGDRIAIDLRGPNALGEGIRVSATVRRLAPAERRDGVLAGVSFDDPGAVHSVVPIELHHVFNRRKAFRVVVGPYEPVEVEFRPSMAKPSRGKMVDLSATGIGVTVEAEAARRIPPRLLIVTIAFTLPYHGKVVATSTIRCRVPTGNGERLGLSFDGRGSRNWGKNERVISQYLMRRQLEIRRAQNPLPP